MNKIGLLGASTIYELGSPDDVELFFNTVSETLEQGSWGANYPVVMLKLYKKALSFDEIKTAKLEMDEIQARLSKLPLNKRQTLFLYDDFGEFVPMLLGRTEIPYAIEDSKRPVEEFERLADDDLPFWKR